MLSATPLHPASASTCPRRRRILSSPQCVLRGSAPAAWLLVCCARGQGGAARLAPLTPPPHSQDATALEAVKGFLAQHGLAGTPLGSGGKAALACTKQVTPH